MMPSFATHCTFCLRFAFPQVRGMPATEVPHSPISVRKYCSPYALEASRSEHLEKEPCKKPVEDQIRQRFGFANHTRTVTTSKRFYLSTGRSVSAAERGFSRSRSTDRFPARRGRLERYTDQFFLAAVTP